MQGARGRPFPASTFKAWLHMHSNLLARVGPLVGWLAVFYVSMYVPDILQYLDHSRALASSLCDCDRHTYRHRFPSPRCHS